MKRIFEIIKCNRLSILSGFMIGTSYIPIPPWALLFCYTFLWWPFAVESHEDKAQKDSSSLKKVFWAGWWTQFTLSLIGFHWIIITAHDFGFLPWPVALVVLLLFAGFIHLYIPMALTLAHYVHRKFETPPLLRFFSFAIFLSLFEFLWPSIFPWHLGYVWMWMHSPIAQTADVFGFLGLSLITYLLNACVGAGVYCWLKSEKQKTIAFASAIFITLATLHFWGLEKRKDWNQTDAQVTTLSVQANIGNLEKYYAERGTGYQNDILQKFIGLSRRGIESDPSVQIDWMIWPEAAFPDFLDNHYNKTVRPSLVKKFVSEVKIPLFTGAYSKDPGTSANRLSYNALFFVNPMEAEQEKPYRKTYLLAFGEYLPFGDIFPKLYELLPFVSEFGRGKGPQIMNVNIPHLNEKIKIGPQICYESLDPHFSADLAAMGAKIILNVTNDSWFGKTFEPWQHMTMTLARAIEVRRPLVRVTNTGITTAILANGTVLEKSPLHEEWTGIHEISFLKDPPQTFYTKYHSYYVWIMLVFLILLLAYGKFKQRPAKS
jgi:apolipoprotein N-acyltransferase